MEDVAPDHIGLAVLHQELKAVRGLLNLLLTHHVANEALVHILCQEETSSELTQAVLQRSSAGTCSHRVLPTLFVLLLQLF